MKVIIVLLLNTSTVAACTSLKHPNEAPIQLTEMPGAMALRLPREVGGVPYFLHIPSKVNPEVRPLIAVHGISRRADEQIEAFAPLAEISGRVVIAPLFTKSQCRRYQKLVRDRCRADQALFATLREVSASTGIDFTRFDLFGFSGGAQFAHRFALVHPDRVGRLALASAGWYTALDPASTYPYGLAPDRGALFRPNLEAFLQISTLVLVGERDVERDATLRKEPLVDRRQGLTRAERAARWSQNFRNMAARIDVTAEVRFRTLPGCGHSFADCVRRGDLAKMVMDWFGQPRQGCSGHRERGREQRYVPFTNNQGPAGPASQATGLTGLMDAL